MKSALIALSMLMASPAYAPPLGSISYVVSINDEDLELRPYTSLPKCYVTRDFIRKERPEAVVECRAVGTV
jgi:hypothetical protein